MDPHRDESGCDRCNRLAISRRLLAAGEPVMEDIPFRGRSAAEWEREVAPYTDVSTLLWTCSCGGQWHSNLYHHVLTFRSCETLDPRMSDALQAGPCSADVLVAVIDLQGAMPASSAWMPSGSGNVVGSEEPPTPTLDRGGGPPATTASQPSRRQMREIKACDMCRKNRKSCETWHPGQRRNWKEWDKMSGPLRKRAAETATRLARDKAAVTCDACRVDNVECQAVHKGVRSGLRKWLQMSVDEKKSAAGDASRLNGGRSG